MTKEEGELVYTLWYTKLILTGLAASLTVNALMTGMIVFKILKVFMGVKPTSVEKSLGKSSGEVTKLQHVIFVIIESGMALLAIQLIRVVLTSLLFNQNQNAEYGLDSVIGMHEMLNVIIISSIFSPFLAFY